jgi:hypothetical protein
VTTTSQWREILAEVNGVGCCSRPVRLRGIVLDADTGELAESAILVPCKDRRAAVCPSCSRLYQDDAWQLVAAGLRGGKGISPEVVDHPQLFVTLTAPSFGPVHGRSRSGQTTRPCRPRRGESLCPHGVSLSCRVRHHEGDARLGEPLCAECFDYRAAVLWNAHVPRLWERTSLELYRAAARAAGTSTKELRATVRLSYMKVVEFQRRGLVHLHVVVRADGQDGPSQPPPVWLDATVLTSCLRAAAGKASVALPGSTGEQRAVWGSQIDVRKLETQRGQEGTAIAAYVAKYATKTADGASALAHPIRFAAQIEHLDLRPHIAQLVRTAWKLGQSRELRHLSLATHAHALGYTGQFSSKSQRFSTTFAALRQARVLYVRGEVQTDPRYDGDWHYAGRGYDHPEAERLADSLFVASSDLDKQFHTNLTEP